MLSISVLQWMKDHIDFKLYHVNVTKVLNEIPLANKTLFETFQISLILQYVTVYISV